MELTSTLLPLHLQTAEDSGVAAAMSAWKRLTSSTNTASITSAPSPPSSHVQRAWDDQQCCKVQADSLLDAATDHVVRARLLAACSPGSGLEELPLSSVGLKMDDEMIRIAAGFRLGAAVVQADNSALVC